MQKITEVKLPDKPMETMELRWVGKNTGRMQFLKLRFIVFYQKSKTAEFLIQNIMYQSRFLN